MKEPTIVIGPDVRVVVRDDLPPGQVFVVDAATYAVTDLKTGKVTYPFRADPGSQT